MAITRDLGPSKSQSVTLEAVGIAEDMSEIITNIEPEMTYFLSNLKTVEDAKDLEFGWLTEGLTPPGQNAHPEKTDYKFEPVGSVRGMTNYVQHFINSGYVSDAMRKSKKIYSEQDELKRQVQKQLTQQARDMEYMIVNNAVNRAGTATVGALSGGIPYFMQTEMQDVTVTTAGLCTTTDNHNLVTGDFVYFTATTLPDGLSDKVCYYVNVLTDKTFNIYDTLQDAAEKVTDKMVKPSAAGTAVKIKKNNIVDKGSGKADFTVDDMKFALQMAYNRGGNPTDAFMSGSKKQRFSDLVNARATTTRKASDKKMEEIADTFACDFGTVTAHSHRMYPDSRIDFLDLNYWDLKWFERSHLVDNLPKQGSYENFAIEGWLGLKGTQPNASASIINIARG